MLINCNLGVAREGPLLFSFPGQFAVINFYTPDSAKNFKKYGRENSVRLVHLARVQGTRKLGQTAADKLRNDVAKI